MQIELIHDLSEDEIPLFPLDVVLFPGGILPLHIFEQRYRLMIQFCLDNQRTFGIVLIKPGQEVGEQAELYPVGTSVKIIEVDRLADGRMNLIICGQYRLKIIKIRRNLPYLVGQVRTLKIDDVETHEHHKILIAKASRLYRTYESLLSKLVPEWSHAENVPTTAPHLSYQIATRLQIPLPDKQQLLETLSKNQLLPREIELLERGTEKLRATLIARNALEERESTGTMLWKSISLN